MKTFIINNKPIELDDEKEYLDFYLEDGKPRLVKLDFNGMLSGLEKGEFPLDDFDQYLSYLNRWVVDAPRKRGYRKMRSDGMHVLSDEYFFDGDGGDLIIDKLENTGKLAEYLLRELFNIGVKNERKVDEREVQEAGTEI